MAYCKSCGAKLDPDAAFCPACGKAVPREVPPKKQFCVGCGAELSPGSAFCPGCGARQQSAVDRSVPAATAAHSSSQARRAAVQARPVPNRSSDRAPAPAAGSPRRRGRGPIVLAVLLVLGIFAFTAFKAPGFLVKKTRPDYAFPIRPSSLPAAPSERPGESGSGAVSADNPAVTLCGVTVDADPAMLASGSRSVSVSVSGSGTENGVFYERYELSMGAGGAFERPVEVTFPCRISPDTDVSVEHFEDGAWMPLLSFVDESAGTVSAYFGSFSPARVVYRPADVNPSLYVVETDSDDLWVRTLRVKDNYWAILRRTDPAVYGPEVTRFRDDPDNYALPAPTLDPNMELTAAYDAYMQCNQLWGFVDPLINMGIETLPYESRKSIIQFMVDHSGKLSGAMNAIPFITMGAQLAYDLRTGTMDSAGTNLYKNLIASGGTVYSLCTGFSQVGFSLAFLGVSVFGAELDYFVDAARAAQAENIREVYKAYYTETEPFDDDHWYQVFEEAYRDCGGNPDEAMKRVRDAVDAYCGKFWTEVYQDSSDELIFAAVDAGCKNVFMNATEEQKKALTEQQKQEVWRLIETKSMKKIQRFLLAKLQEDTAKHLDLLVRDYNLRMRFTIRETVDLETSAAAKYTGHTLALGRGGEPLPGWSVTIPEGEGFEDGWSVDFPCTVYGYLCMGMPDQVLVYASEDDLQNKASPVLVRSFDPDLKGSRQATVELSGDRNVCTIQGSVRDVDFTITVEGGVVYGIIDGRIRGQVMPGETITITVTSSEGRTFWIRNEYGEGGLDPHDYPGKRDFHVGENKSNLLYTVNCQINQKDQIGALFGIISFAVVEKYTETPASGLKYD